MEKIQQMKKKSMDIHTYKQTERKKQRRTSYILTPPSLQQMSASSAHRTKTKTKTETMRKIGNNKKKTKQTKNEKATQHRKKCLSIFDDRFMLML